MFGADITHVRYLFSAEEWLVHKSHLIKQSTTADGYLYLLDEQTGYVWEKVQLRCSGQYFTLIPDE